ncbi:MAG: cation diffusion facilitator family transporter, partial [Syntrophobacteraceae bacterium]|nr:cation diffusion facilitator family transporter [Syntrophobacteraceae bacterium]
MTHETSSREKRSVALLSVFAAVGLTAFKLAVGLLTNSLGILAEAAHSGLDLVAALMTYFAVRVSDKPADDRHHFGHGKVEYLSSLFETILLLATSAWIISEAVDRLFFNPARVEASLWSFVVMGSSIVIDVNRSRMLSRAAKKYNSQALEADALHFSTDIWSSAVVILGLVGITVSKVVPNLEWMHQADSVAALVVAVALAGLTLPLFNQLAGKRMDLALLATPGLAAAAIGLVLAIALMAGAYPAFIISAFRPASVLKGEVRKGAGGGLLRRALVVFQFAVSVVLIVGTVVVFRQLRYIRNEKVGFNRD